MQQQPVETPEMKQLQEITAYEIYPLQNYIVNTCFDLCINDFTTTDIVTKERKCMSFCYEKNNASYAQG